MQRILLAALALASAGCFSPRGTVTVGASVRQIRGNYNGFRSRATIPVGTVRLAQPMGKKLEIWHEWQGNQGRVPADHLVARGEGEGWLWASATGIALYPAETRLLGLTMGGEFFEARYRMTGRLGPLRSQERDHFSGVGLVLGLRSELPLDRNKRFGLVIEGGYRFTDTWTTKARIDGDGWYGTIGLAIQLGP